MSVKTLGKIIFSFLVVGIIGTAPTVLADTYHVLADIPNFSGTIPETFTVGDYVVAIFKVGIGLAGVLAVIMIIIGGISYMMSEMVGSKEEAKGTITNAIFGLLLALGAYAILNTINPDILCFRFLGSDCGQQGGGTPGSNVPSPPVVVPNPPVVVPNPPQPDPNSGCAPGTISLGDGQTYIEGNLIPSELCALPNLTSGGMESNQAQGNPYYMEGADGKAIVAASVSGAWYSLIQAMIADGVPVSATSSFRTNQHQADLYQAYQNGTGNLAAQPGHSNHQAGLAIDFGGTHVYVAGATCANRAAAHGDPMWEWLHAHAGAEYGIRQLASESWHWDTINNGTRCP